MFDIFIKHSHHCNLSIVCTSQNIFHQSQYGLTLRRNVSDWIIFFPKNDSQAIRQLSEHLFLYTYLFVRWVDDDQLQAELEPCGLDDPSCPRFFRISNPNFGAFDRKSTGNQVERPDQDGKHFVCPFRPLVDYKTITFII